MTKTKTPLHTVHPVPTILRTDAYFSPCRKYRYWLIRVWDDSLPVMANFGVNPSTADEKKNDPTVRRDIGFADMMGYGGLLKLNVGAYRSTDPKKWIRAEDPIGPENTIDDLETYIQLFDCQKIVAAWGRSIGKYACYGEMLGQKLEMWCFGLNKDGTPVHTLMLPYTAKLERYRP